MIDCFALDEYIRNYDFKKTAGDLKFINMMSGLFPKEYTAYQELNKLIRLTTIVNQVKSFLITILTKSNGTIPVTVYNDDQINQFIKELDPNVLSSAKVLYVKNPVLYLNKDQINAINDLFLKQGNQIGAIDAAERVALIKVGNTTYFIPFRLLKYNNEWFIESFVSYVSSDFPGMMTEEEFLRKYP